MREERFFKNKKMNTERLLAYGFVLQERGYVYSAALLKEQFELTVTVTAETVETQIIDTAAGEEYVLHRVPDAGGTFVGQIKEEYEAILRSISENCFERDVFKSTYARMVIQYVREKYHNEPEYLWERFPSNAVWRRADNEKWYGALLVIPRAKLGTDSTETVDILDLRMKPENIESLVDGKHYFPGYHMNKRNWITICLDGSVPLEEIYNRIDLSYQIAAKK